MGPAGLCRLRRRRPRCPGRGSAVEEALRAAASARLAPYKRPKTYVAASDLPHTATGKLMRRAVPEHLGLAGGRALERPQAKPGRTGPCPSPPPIPPPERVEKEFPAHTPEQVDALLGRAVAAFASYKTTTFGERALHLITAAELLEGEVPDIARILTTEMGKTFAAAKGEVAKCAVGLRWFAEHARGAAGRRADRDRRHTSPTCTTSRSARCWPSCRGTSPCGR